MTSINNFFASKDSTIMDKPIAAALGIFSSDDWFTKVALDTYRGVKYTITQEEGKPMNMNVSWTRNKEEGYQAIDVAEVLELGPKPDITTVQLANSPSLLASCLFSYVRNLEVLLKFAEFWCPLSTEEKERILRLPAYVQAAYLHISWLLATCKNRNLKEAEFDKVTCAVGLDHKFPKFTDVDLENIGTPSYFGSYIDLWQHNLNQEISNLLCVDYVKFKSYVKILQEYPELLKDN